MNRSRLLLGVSSVLAGTAVLMAVLGVVYNLLFVVLALPFGLAGALLWYHATGRLGRRIRRRAARGEPRVGGPGSGGSRGGRFSDGGRRARNPEAGDRAGYGAAGWDRRDRGPGSAGTTDRVRPVDAHGVLGVEVGADEETVRRAYREKVKAVHPDTEGGSEEAFKRVTAAYERLTE